MGNWLRSQLLKLMIFISGFIIELQTNHEIRMLEDGVVQKKQCVYIYIYSLQYHRCLVDGWPKNGQVMFDGFPRQRFFVSLSLTCLWCVWDCRQSRLFQEISLIDELSDRAGHSLVYLAFGQHKQKKGHSHLLTIIDYQ